MIEFVEIQALNALVYSMLLFILALGLSLTFGLLRVVNLAHGSFFMFGAYISISVWNATGSFWLAVLASAVLVGMLGAALERLWLRHFYTRGDLDQVILTFGFALVLIDVAKMLWGKDILSLPTPALFSGSVDIANTSFPEYRLFLIAVGVVLFLGTWLAIERTQLGALIRAAVSDRHMVGGLGFDVFGLFTLTFGFGALLAGVGGALGAPLLGAYPGLDFDVLITTLIVVVVGGLGNITGAFWSSLLIGFSDTFGKALIPQLASFIIFAVMALALLVRSLGMPDEDAE